MLYYTVTLECEYNMSLGVEHWSPECPVCLWLYKGVHGCPKSKQATAARWKRCIGVLCQTRTQAPPKVSFEYGACG